LYSTANWLDQLHYKMRLIRTGINERKNFFSIAKFTSFMSIKEVFSLLDTRNMSNRGWSNQGLCFRAGIFCPQSKRLWLKRGLLFSSRAFAWQAKPFCRQVI